ncbi:hypothetical protein F751_1081 [Auxenochlorella protothecoides]|uniref:Uncharacterized protein n=1 Tax=Auxenochlorella protothecoides TaxID=3075 RepID=A0A087SCD1_AUXPR|nr:hypothetical protein F751_1081 [Auxenochlorella protothecoides]KFM23385.1 hypothetical protein F751_1081 [Auxenochlorella protothecoides]
MALRVRDWEEPLALLGHHLSTAQLLHLFTVLPQECEDAERETGVDQLADIHPARARLRAWVPAVLPWLRSVHGKESRPGSAIEASILAAFSAWVAWGCLEELEVGQADYFIAAACACLEPSGNPSRAQQGVDVLAEVIERASPKQSATLERLALQFASTAAGGPQGSTAVASLLGLYCADSRNQGVVAGRGKTGAALREALLSFLVSSRAPDTGTAADRLDCALAASIMAALENVLRDSTAFGSALFLLSCAYLDTEAEDMVTDWQQAPSSVPDLAALLGGVPSLGPGSPGPTQLHLDSLACFSALAPGLVPALAARPERDALLGRALDLSLGCLRAAGGAEPGGPAPARRAALLERSPGTLCTLCLAAQRAGAPPTQALVPALESAIAFLAQAGPASVGAPDACRQLAVAATHICAGLPAASLGAPAMALVTACGPGGGLPPAAALASTLALLEAFECRGAGDPATSAPARASSSQALAGWRALARDAGASLPRAELADRLSRCLASCLALAPDLARPELPGLLEWCVGCMARPGEESTHVLLCRALETWGADVTARPLLLRAVLDVLGRGVAGSDAATVAARQTTLLCALRTLRSDRVAQAELAPRAAEAATAGMSSQNPTLARNALKLLAELLLPLGIEGSSAPGLLRSLAPTVVCALFVAFASPVLAWPLPQLAKLTGDVGLLAALCALEEGLQGDVVERATGLLAGWSAQAGRRLLDPGTLGEREAGALQAAWEWGPAVSVGLCRGVAMLGLAAPRATSLAQATRDLQLTVAAVAGAMRAAIAA